MLYGSRLSRDHEGHVPELKEDRAVASPIARALGSDFQKLHVAVRRHYAEPTVVAQGTMDVIHVKRTIRLFTLISYRLIRAPVPHSGRGISLALENRIDSSNVMHWVRTFYKNRSFPETITFVSQMFCSGERKVIETTRYGLGVEANLSVTGDGSLVFDTSSYVVVLPYLGLIVRFPTWLSPFGRGHTKEIGETEDSFKVEFEMNHPIFGRTVAYSGRCQFETPR